MKKIIIIGGGIAGLSCGIHAQQYGFQSEIYESHSIVGGQCTGWDRKGFHIDGCIDWLTGTKEGSDLNETWKNVGALGKDVPIFQRERFGIYEFGDTKITLWKDLARLESELIAISPEDKEEIKTLIQDIKTVQTMEMPAKMPVDMLSFTEQMKLLMNMRKAFGLMGKSSKISCEDYANRYHHPALKKLFTTMMTKQYSVMSLLFSLATFSSGNGAIPEGGSREMAFRMEKRYRELGGKVITNCPAEEIVVENGTATAVRFTNGTVEKADYIISACDAKVTFQKLLKGKYKDEQFELRYNNQADYMLPSCVLVSYGVDADLSDYPTSITFETTPYHVGESNFTVIGTKNYSYQQSFAPKGQTVVTSLIEQFDDDYLYWEKLYKDKEAYRAEKQRVADEVLARIEQRFPELKGKITLLDVATPMTYNRYTGAYHGAWMSFMLTAKSKRMAHKGIIKGLKNCYLTGQWIEPPGGLPVAVTTGKFTVQRICKKEKIKL